MDNNVVEIVRRIRPPSCLLKVLPYFRHRPLSLPVVGRLLQLCKIGCVRGVHGSLFLVSNGVIRFCWSKQVKQNASLIEQWDQFLMHGRLY